MRHCLARLIHPHYRLCPDGDILGFHRFGARRLRHKVLLAHTKRANAPLLPEQGPDLISGAVTMDDATLTTFLSLARRTSTKSRFNCRALLNTGSSQSFIRYGCTSSLMRQHNAMSSPAWPKQLDALLIALHSLPQGTWSALTDPPPSRACLHMVDTIPACGGPNPSSCFVFPG